MVDKSVIELLEQLRTARQPEEIFGQPTDLEALKRIYRQLVQRVHPDLNTNTTPQAEEAFKLLLNWYAQAKYKMAQGLYGKQLQIDVTSPSSHYQGYDAPISGDLADLYPIELDRQSLLLKIVRKPSNNDLLSAESQALKRVFKATEGQPLQAHFPRLIESFRIDDQMGLIRQCNVLSFETKYVSLADVIESYPQGIDSADAAWMFNRLLAVLGVAHGQGVVHGAVLPNHLLLRLSDHNGMLIDWCYSVAIGESIKAISPTYKAYYPPEIFAKLPATPATDIYMAAICMVAVLGGNVATKQLPPTVPKSIQALLKACLIDAPHRRAYDAWSILEEFHEILGRLYGSPKFRPFALL